jgi:hypothetical protein
MLGGIVCNVCKRMLVIEMAKVNSGIKKISETQISIRPFLKQIEKQVK